MPLSLTICSVTPVLLQPTVDALTYAGRVGVDVVNMSFFIDPWLFNCANGTLDLRTMVQRPHDPADRISKVANAAYRADTSGKE